MNSQSALQTTESYHRNSGREFQTGRAGRVGVGAYRETRGFKEETPASEIQVQGERNPRAAQSSILVLLSLLSLSYLTP